MTGNTTIILPTLNEEKAISKTIKTIQRVCDNHILVIDGHSTDNTTFYASAFNNVDIIYDVGKGKGAALRQAFADCYPDNVVFVDVDGTYEIHLIKEFISALEEGYDTVVGRKYYLKGSQPEFMGIGHYAVGDVLWNVLFGIFYGHQTANNLSGFRGLSRKAIELMQLEQDRWGIETEIEAKTIKLCLTEKVIDVKYGKRTGESKADFSLFSRDNYALWKSFFRYILWCPK